MKLDELKSMAKNVGLKSVTKYRKSELIDHLLKAGDLEKIEKLNQKEKQKKELPDRLSDEIDNSKEINHVQGILELHPDGGYGFLRRENYL